MNFPLISKYVEAIMAAEENFNELTHLRPVLDANGQPVMTSGNFAVVFKMKDEQTGKLYAVKCFLKEQEGRAEAYRQIAEELEYVSSTFLTPIKYFDKELFVDSGNSDENEFPVLLMDWVEGQTLDKYIREHIDDEYELSLLAYQFSRLAMWLMPLPFAHGDLKPDNILVREDGTLALVDYDGMYVPAMKGQKARELGSPDFRHPARTEDDFDEHIDDFSLVSILLSLKAISLQPELLEQYGASDRLLFSEKDYRDISQCEILHQLFPADDKELNRLYSLFLLCFVEGSLPFVLYHSFNILRPEKDFIDIPLLEKRAHNNDTTSQYKLGVCYLDGKGVEKNIEEGIKWLKMAADSGHAKALHVLGDCYREGEGVEKDNYKALELYHKAELNYKKEYLCRLMESIVLALQDIGEYEKMMSYVEEYVQKGKGCRECSLVKNYNKKERCCPWMQEKLGNCYYNGNGVEKDYAKAVEWYTKAAEQGNAEGQWRLGNCYCSGNGVEKDDTKAVEWYTKAAEQGDSAGQWRLGNCYYYGYGVEKDYVKAVEWYTKAAEQGDSDGQWLLGTCYILGYGVEKDYVKAVEWYTKSAEQGNSDGQWRLGYCYYNGNGVEKDYVKAVEWYTKSAEQGNSKGQWRLGNCYYYGEGVEEDYAKAVEWYTKAAEQGHIRAKEELKKFSTEVTDEDLADAWTDEYGVKYSKDRKRLLEAPEFLTEYSIKKGTIVVSDSAFYGCRSLTSIVIPDGVTNIGNDAFCRCEGLGNIIIPNSVTKIGNAAFMGCETLNHIVIPDNVTNIEESTFCDCDGLISIVIPNSITSIGDWAFCACKSLISIVIPDSVTSIGKGTFADCDSLKSIIIPIGTKQKFEQLLPDYKEKLVEQDTKIPNTFLPGEGYISDFWD